MHIDSHAQNSSAFIQQISVAYILPQLQLFNAIEPNDSQMHLPINLERLVFFVFLSLFASSFSSLCRWYKIYCKERARIEYVCIMMIGTLLCYRREIAAAEKALFFIENEQSASNSCETIICILIAQLLFNTILIIFLPLFIIINIVYTPKTSIECQNGIKYNNSDDGNRFSVYLLICCVLLLWSLRFFLLLSHTMAHFFSIPFIIKINWSILNAICVITSTKNSLSIERIFSASIN